MPKHSAVDCAVSGKVKRVLAVDDSLDMRALERKLLEQLGYEVELAVDGIDAWNAVRERRFDLVLTDIDMPLIDGIKLTRLIRKHERLALLPVLIVVDEGCGAERSRAFDAGADHCVIRGRMDEMLAQALADLIGP